MTHRIAHILAWPTVAGTEIATLRIAQCLPGPDYHHVAFCTSEAPRVESLFRGAGFQTAVYRSVDLSYRRPGAFLEASLRLARDLRHLEIDMVHCSDLLAGLRAAPAAKLARLPVLCHVRNPHPDIPRHDKPLLWAVDRFIFVSRHTWSAFGYSVPPDRGSVVYDGIETTPVDRDAAKRQLLEQFALPPDANLVGMVGRLAPQKDYATFFRAAARVLSARPNVRFLVVGDHAANDAFRRHYEDLRHLLESLDLTPHVIFTGFRSDIPQVLSGLDVFVLCTNFEGLPLVILEAMAQQTPVIATAVGGIPEIVFDGKTGLLHRHADADHLASQIVRVLSETAPSRHRAAAGRRLVEERFTFRRFAADMDAVYRLVLPPRRVAKPSGDTADR
jgi:glycosyltransferase involved in cell wall biosynthesis